MSTDAKEARKSRLDSEQGLVFVVGVLVMLGAAAIMVVTGW